MLKISFINNNKITAIMTWKINYAKKLGKYNNSILIAGLPGIANTGKIAVDYLATELKAKKIADFSSDKGPAFTLINEENEVTMPKIELHHKKIKNKDFFFLVGDYQPVEDEESYYFCSYIIELAKKLNVKQIITLGGIGLEEEPEKPQVYAAVNNKKFAKELQKYKINTKVSKKVSTIIGVTGLLIALPKVNAAAILAETSIFPAHIGLNPAKELIKKLNNMFNFEVKFNNLNKEIKEIKKLTDSFMLQHKKMTSKKKVSDINYIG